MARKLTPYHPLAQDIRWAQQLINLLRDGGMTNTSAGVYKLDKTNKKFILTTPASPWDNPCTLMLHHRHTYVWKEVGYTVEPVVDWDAIELPDLPEETKPHESN